MTTATTATTDGAVLSSYRILGPVGEGGMGVVYRAEHVLLKRPAAIKVLQPELSRNQEMVGRFFNEARAATAIRHPGIVEIYDFGFGPDGSAFIVMELLAGESLAQRLARSGSLTPARAIQIGRQIAGALAAAHAQGIVHRDLKPDNVFLVPDPEVPGGERIKLLDFGIAKLVAEPSAMHKTRTGALMGTPTYMAPEQCRGVQVDHRADLYSLGCILFECVCGRPPFGGEGVGDVLSAHIHVAPPSPRQLAPVSPALEAVILHLLSKSPDARPATAAVVIQELDGAAHDAGSTIASGGAVPRTSWGPAGSGGYATTLTGASTSVPGSVAAPPQRRPAALVAAIAAVVAVIAIAIGVASTRGSGDEEGRAASGAASKEAAAPMPAAASPATPSQAAASASPAAPSQAAASASPTAPGQTAPAAATPAAAEPATPSALPDGVSTSIDSVPSGAVVVADGVVLGRTPLRTRLPSGAGQITLSIRLDGYQEARLRVSGDRPIETTIVLERKRRQTQPRRPTADPDRGVNPF